LKQRRKAVVAMLCTIATEIAEDVQPMAVRGQPGTLSASECRELASALALAGRQMMAIAHLLLGAGGCDRVPSSAHGQRNAPARRRRMVSAGRRMQDVGCQ
jgi:hypothetical protein